MKETGETMLHQAEESSITLMETYMMAAGKMTKLTATESTTMLTAPNMKESGRMINSMGKDMNHGQMAVNSMGFTLNLRRKEEACIHGLMETNMLETGLIISFQAQVYIPGVMEGSITDNGKIMSCMEKEPTNGLMAGCITENIKMTRRMGLVFMFG